VADLGLVLVQTRYQLAGVARKRRAVVFSLVFPVVLLLMFDSVFGQGNGHGRAGRRDGHRPRVLHGRDAGLRHHVGRLQPAGDRARDAARDAAEAPPRNAAAGVDVHRRDRPAHGRHRGADGGVAARDRPPGLRRADLRSSACGGRALREPRNRHDVQRRHRGGRDDPRHGQRHRCAAAHRARPL
jgi:hypothetical protein